MKKFLSLVLAVLFVSSLALAANQRNCHELPSNKEGWEKILFTLYFNNNGTMTFKNLLSGNTFLYGFAGNTSDAGMIYRATKGTLVSTLIGPPYFPMRGGPILLDGHQYQCDVAKQ